MSQNLKRHVLRVSLFVEIQSGFDGEEFGESRLINQVNRALSSVANLDREDNGLTKARVSKVETLS